MVNNITCIMLTKNSLENIDNLRNIYSVFRKIVIVDDFSEDGTVEKIQEIDKENRIKIHKRKLDDFATQRNFATSLAETDWVFHLDSDEDIDDELIKELISLDKDICSVSEEVFKVTRKNFFIDVYIGEEEKFRLYNRRKLEFIGEVHEDLNITPTTRISKIKGSILHKSYNKIEDYFQKLILYMKLEKEKLGGKNYGLVYIIAQLCKRLIVHLKVLLKNSFVNKSFFKALLWFILCIAYDLLYFAIYLYVKYIEKSSYKK